MSRTSIGSRGAHQPNRAWVPPTSATRQAFRCCAESMERPGRCRGHVRRRSTIRSIWIVSKGWRAAPGPGRKHARPPRPGQQSTRNMSVLVIRMEHDPFPGVVATLHHTGPATAFIWLQRFSTGAAASGNSRTCNDRDACHGPPACALRPTGGCSRRSRCRSPRKRVWLPVAVCRRDRVLHGARTTLPDSPCTTVAVGRSSYPASATSGHQPPRESSRAVKRRRRGGIVGYRFPGHRVRSCTRQ